MSAFDTRDITQSPEYQQELAIQKTFMARVYGWMTIGLLLTALTALVVAGQPAVLHTIFDTGWFWAIFLAQLGIAFGFRYAVRALPSPVVAGLFLAYSILMGVVLSVVLLVYTLPSIAATFFITAGMFASMSVFGFVTKRNLDGLGSMMMMGFFGMFIALIVNIFMQSPAMNWLISFVGVIVFTGLTAFHTQKIKQGYAAGDPGSVVYRKFAVVGAMALYVDFIELFFWLLQFMGKRRD